MRALLLVPWIAIALAPPLPAVAQSPAPASTHAHAAAHARTVLALRNVRLVIPPGAVAEDAVVGLGVGGVPNPGADRPVGSTGFVVTAAGGLRGPVIAVVHLSAVDKGAVGDAYPALLDTATGDIVGCPGRQGAIRCVIGRPSAYLLIGTSKPSVADTVLEAELDEALRSPVEKSRPRWQPVIVVALAAVAGFVAVWWRTSRGNGETRAL